MQSTWQERREQPGLGADAMTQVAAAAAAAAAQAVKRAGDDELSQARLAPPA
jgi:hypothetical protein